MDDFSEKGCSICGKTYPLNVFTYGKRENRSYCPECDKKAKTAYSRGGVEAAREFRESMRRTWRDKVG